MKVFYYSELLDKSFDTEQACLNAEKAHLDAEKGKKLAKDAVETAKENVRKAERKLQEVCDMAQKLYEKRLAMAENDFENSVSTAKFALAEAKKQLKIVIDKYDYKEVRNGILWDLFTY